MRFLVEDDKKIGTMRKKTYQSPNIEKIIMHMDSSLLEWWSATWGVGGGDAVAEGKQNCFDDFDFLEDEDIEPVWSFNVWE